MKFNRKEMRTMKKSKETDFTYKLNPIITKVGFGDTGGEPFLLTLLETEWSEEEPFRIDVYIGVTVNEKNKDEFEA